MAHAKTCRSLGVSESWFYTWHDREPAARQARRAELDAAVRLVRCLGRQPGDLWFAAVWEDLVEAGWKVSVNTVADSMIRQGVAGGHRSASGAA